MKYSLFLDSARPLTPGTPRRRARSRRPRAVDQFLTMKEGDVLGQKPQQNQNNSNGNLPFI